MDHSDLSQYDFIKSKTFRARSPMNNKSLLSIATAFTLFAGSVYGDDLNGWTFGGSIYGLAAGMSGKVAVKGVPADVDVGFDKIWEHLKLGAMGTATVGYDRWSMSTDVIYMDLRASKGSVQVQARQWMVEPTIGYVVCQYFTAYAGSRFNSIHLAINGPLGVNPASTHDWWDPIVGGKTSIPLGKGVSLDLNGDVGGFGVSSDVTWQLFPHVSWRFNRYASLQAGYRFLYTDYQTGSGLSRFKYDMLTTGPQIGFEVAV